MEAFANGKWIFKFKAHNKNFNFPIQFCLGSTYDGFGALEPREVIITNNFKFNNCLFEQVI